MASPGALLVVATLLCLASPPIAVGQEAAPDTPPAPATDCLHSAAPYWKAQPSGPCCGFFEPPPLPALRVGEMRVQAPRSKLRADGATHLSGGASVDFGTMRLRAGEAVIDAEDGRVTLSGGVHIDRPEAAFSADGAALDRHSGHLELRQLRYVLFDSQAHGSAERANWSAGQLRLDRASFSWCPPGEGGWHFELGSLRVDRERGYAVMRDARLYWGSRQLLRLPAWWLPIGHRRSGLLLPDISYSSDGGVRWHQPLYLNLAPHYDATLALATMTRRGALLAGEFRRRDHFGSWQAALSFLPDDRVAGARRWHYRLVHAGGSGAWQTEVDVSRVSDRRYFDDLRYLSSGMDARRHALPQRLQVRHSDSAHHVALGWERHQSLAEGLSDNGYQREPWLSAGVQFGVPGAGPALAVALDYDRFAHADRVLPDGGRLHASVEADWTRRRGALSWRPWLRLTQLWHEGHGSVVAPAVGIDLAWFALRQLSAGGALRRLHHRLRYQYVPRRGQAGRPVYDSRSLRFDRHQLFRTSRFSGFDRIADANRLSWETSVEWLWPRHDAELRLSLGQIYYFADRRVALVGGGGVASSGRSPLAIAFGARLAPWVLALDLAWDERNGRLDMADWELAWRSEGGAELAAQWYFARGGVASGQQAGLRVELPLGSRWRWHGAWSGELASGKLIDAEMGLDYRSCCWGIGLGFRRSLHTAGYHTGDMLLKFHFGRPPPTAARDVMVYRHD